MIASSIGVTLTSSKYSLLPFLKKDAPLSRRSMTIDSQSIDLISPFIAVLTMSSDFTFIIAFFGIFFGAAIILAIVVFGVQSRNMKNKREHELAMEKIELEKERLSKAIIMVPCKYCGGLVPQASAECPNCGAKRPL
jgi:hypothetical protein